MMFLRGAAVVLLGMLAGLVCCGLASGAEYLVIPTGQGAGIYKTELILGFGPDDTIRVLGTIPTTPIDPDDPPISDRVAAIKAASVPIGKNLAEAMARLLKGVGSGDVTRLVNGVFPQLLAALGGAEAEKLRTWKAAVDRIVGGRYNAETIPDILAGLKEAHGVDPAVEKVGEPRSRLEIRADMDRLAPQIRKPNGAIDWARLFELIRFIIELITSLGI